MCETIDKSDAEYIVHIGRVEGGRSFVLVKHIPSGKERGKILLGWQNVSDVEKQLVDEIRAELESNDSRDS